MMIPIFLLTFVDDLLLCGKSQIKLNKVQELLFEKCKMKDLGEINLYLGINIEYKENRNIMTLDQQNYIESLALEYKIENSKL